MYPITPELYRQTAERLLDTIGDSNYFSGSLRFTAGEAECRLTASILVYRTLCRLPEGEGEVVTDLVPVWWEFHTEIDGCERLNDFSFSELRQLVRPCGAGR